jgi:hypothetical protein
MLSYGRDWIAYRGTLRVHRRPQTGSAIPMWHNVRLGHEGLGERGDLPVQIP